MAQELASILLALELFGFFWLLCQAFGLFYAWVMYVLDYYEDEPVTLLGFVYWSGAVLTLGAYVLNSLANRDAQVFLNGTFLSNYALGSLIAPFLEELLKGLVLAFVFLFSRRHFNGVVDGIVYATTVSLGFAASENALYLFRSFNTGGLEPTINLFIVRVILGAGTHAVFTSAFGLGLAASRNSSNSSNVLIRFFAPLLGLGISMILHSVHNTMANAPFGEVYPLVFLTDFVGFCIVFFALIYGLLKERGYLKKRISILERF